MNGRFLALAAACSLIVAGSSSAQAQVNNFEKMVGTWTHTSPNPGETTPVGSQIIIREDGGVFTNFSQSISGSAGRCIDGGANFCFEGTDPDGRRFRCSYSISFILPESGRRINSLNFRPTRESNVVLCPRGEYRRSL